MVAPIPEKSRDVHHHWADVAADRTLRAHPGLDQITVAAGITPSGVVHIGNFREVVTVDLVARALADRGVKVRFIYSWDDFDVFRKVPADAPQPDALQLQLGRSIADVPDPWGEHDSYASHHIANFEASLRPLGIAPEFIRQAQAYRSGRYAQGIRTALESAGTIIAILNGSRERHGALSMLPPEWLPLAGFCSSCGYDQLKFQWDHAWQVQVTCNRCDKVDAVDLREGGSIKLPWRIDWPMRWAHERVCFEPGGKDHSSAGGSYDTAKDIVRQVYGWTAPEYVGYDFVSLKGAGGKISSSQGGVTTVADCLAVYEPEVLRWMFASYRPNTEFQISFDADVIKLYEDFDRTVRLAHEGDDGTDADRKRKNARRTLQFASVHHRPIVPGTPAPQQVGFRHLSVVVQIFDGDVERTLDHLQQQGQLAPQARDVCRQRLICARNWVVDHAPEEFRYQVRSEGIRLELTAEHRALLQRVIEAVQQAPDGDETALAHNMKALANDGLDLKALYPIVYQLLLGRDRGPKLTSLLATLGRDRALALLQPSAS